MKKLTLTMLSCIFISLIILSCRKEIFSEQFDNDTFFSYSTSDKMIAWAANSLKAQNATVKFAEEMQAKFGMPAWDNSLAFNDDAGMATVITPFTDEDEKQVTAIWIIYYQNGQLNTKIITRDDVRKLKIEKPDTKADANDYAIMFGYLESKIFNTGVKAVPSDNAVADSVAARQRAVEGWVTIEICTSYYQYAMVNGEYIPGTHQYTGTRCFTQTTWVPDAQPPFTPSYTPPYIPPYGGGGETTITIPISGSKIDPKKENECFDVNQSAQLTIYIQQGKENSRDLIGPNQVGHAFIGIRQNGIERYYGFYPETNANTALVAVGKSYTSELRDNSGELFHVSISKNIDNSQLASIIKYANNPPSIYNVNTYACTDFAIAIGKLGGINLPSTKSTSLAFNGTSPGNLGEDVRDGNFPGTTKTTKQGKAPNKSGTCK